jgi:hypothetical protein
VSCVVCTDDRNWGRDALLVAVAVVNEDVDGRSGNCDVANAQFRVVNPTLFAEIFWEDAVHAGHARHVGFVLATQDVSLMAAGACPRNRMRQLSEIRGDRDAARSGEKDAGALLSGGLHTAVRTGKAQLRILFEMIIAEVLGVDVVHACHASHVISVQAAGRVHLEAPIVMPSVGGSGLSVVCRHSQADRPFKVDASAELRRGLHATLLGTDRLNDEAELGKVSPMFFA